MRVGFFVFILIQAPDLHKFRKSALRPRARPPRAPTQVDRGKCANPFPRVLSKFLMFFLSKRTNDIRTRPSKDSRNSVNSLPPPVNPGNSNSAPASTHVDFANSNRNVRNSANGPLDNLALGSVSFASLQFTMKLILI